MIADQATADIRDPRSVSKGGVWTAETDVRTLYLMEMLRCMVCRIRCAVSNEMEERNWGVHERKRQRSDVSLTEDESITTK